MRQKYYFAFPIWFKAKYMISYIGGSGPVAILD